MFMRMIYDEKLAQAAYLIGCQRSGEAIVIDPERDVDRYIRLAAENGLRIVAVAETHIHADFVSGARELAEAIGAKVYVSDEGGLDWRSEWLDARVAGGSYLHQRLRDGDTFSIGLIELRVMHTPGHTPEHIAFLVTDRGAGASEPMGMASGDFIFVGDLGRPDLLETAAGQTGAMEPAARRLFATVSKLSFVPDYVQVWPAHGAGSACGKALGAVPTSTIGYERRYNPAIRAATADERTFVNFILRDQPEPPLYFARMKHLNRVGPPLLGCVPFPPQIAMADLARLDAKRVAIADTRSWDDFAYGHIPGALSFPLSNAFNTEAASMIRPEEDVFLVIDAEHLEEAVRDLIRVGVDQLRGWCPAAEINAAAADAGSAAHLVTIPEISATAAAEALAAGRVNYLDVRRAAEFVAGHAPGAQNIAHIRLAGRLDEVPRDKPLVVGCRSGARSARAAALLQREGLTVMNLAGGIMAWERARAPIVREPAVQREVPA
ncbi:MAG: MBL fold metallo-hydrolase [Phycisphaerales bacterium]|nr:MBL fold metallo-hydrolase [Phycisphaerales bacterium]